MKKFMIIYISPISSVDQMKVGTDEMQKGIQAWSDWFTKQGNAIIDPGNMLGNGIEVSKNGSTQSKAPIGGYSIVQAEDIDTVEKMVADNPNLMIPEASIEIFEIMPMM